MSFLCHHFDQNINGNIVRILAWKFLQLQCTSRQKFLQYFHRYFGRNHDTKKTFQNQLTFKDYHSMKWQHHRTKINDGLNKNVNGNWKIIIFCLITMQSNTDKAVCLLRNEIKVNSHLKHQMHMICFWWRNSSISSV